MLRIGQFSKVSKLSVKTLRFYDQKGLVPPAFIDEQTGYRYYAEDQLLTVKRIQSFKEQGFTLDQIKIFLHDISHHEILEQLIKKQHELLRTLSEAEKQLVEINDRIHRIQSSDPGSSLNTMLIRNVKPQLAATIRDVIPRSELCLLIDEIIKFIQSRDSGRLNAIMMIWHSDSHEENVPVDVEVAIPIAKRISGNGRVQVRQLPGMKTAAFIHECDPHAHRCSAIDKLASWITNEKGLSIASKPYREIYLTSDHDIYGRSRLSELQIPVT